MLPAFGMTIIHLRLQESSEATITCPSNTIASLYAALYNDLLLHDHVNVDPDSVAQNLLQLCISVNVLLLL